MSVLSKKKPRDQLAVISDQLPVIGEWGVRLVRVEFYSTCEVGMMNW